jgi:hypothetical protein
MRANATYPNTRTERSHFTISRYHRLASGRARAAEVHARLEIVSPTPEEVVSGQLMIVRHAYGGATVRRGVSYLGRSSSRRNRSPLHD